MKINKYLIRFVSALVVAWVTAGCCIVGNSLIEIKDNDFMINSSDNKEK